MHCRTILIALILTASPVVAEPVPVIEGVARITDGDTLSIGPIIIRLNGIDAPEAGQVKRLGFLTGRVSVPDDFDRMGEAEILSQFGLDDESAS